MTCDCGRTARPPITTTTDLGEFANKGTWVGIWSSRLIDNVMKNIDGIISCHDFLGKGGCMFPRACHTCADDDEQGWRSIHSSLAQLDMTVRRSSWTVYWVPIEAAGLQTGSGPLPGDGPDKGNAKGLETHGHSLSESSFH